MKIVITDSARKHGISDENMVYVREHAVFELDITQNDDDEKIIYVNEKFSNLK